MTAVLDVRMTSTRLLVDRDLREAVPDVALFPHTAPLPDRTRYGPPREFGSHAGLDMSRYIVTMSIP